MNNQEHVRVFAVLSALERDLRSLFVDSGETVPLNPGEQARASERYGKDRKLDQLSVPDDLGELLPYLDLSELLDVLNRVGSRIEDRLALDRKSIAKVTEVLKSTVVSIRNRVCHSRELEPGDYIESVHASKRVMSIIGSNRMTQSSVLLRQLDDLPDTQFPEIPEFWKDDISIIENNLPVPDYADVGFVGRARDRKSLQRAIAGPYPIITITGEGGVGKTSLVLRCLYDILPQTDRFDLIYWASLKSNHLTPGGIRALMGGLSTEFDVLHSFAEYFGGGDGEKAIGRLFDNTIEILSIYRVLLVIDNLETVERMALNPLLESFPLGSKLLLTSRVGMGNHELRIALDPMSPGDARQLLRRSAELVHEKELSTAPNGDIEDLCKQLFYNPLAIRWFVQSYSLGTPQSVLLNSTQNLSSVLDFCFQNLYDRLTGEQKEILEILSVLGSLSEVEIALLSSYEDVELVRNSLSYLDSSNLLKRTRDDSILERSELWTVSDFARAYLKARVSVPQDRRVSLQRRYQRVISDRDAARNQYEFNRYDTSVIFPRNRDEACVVAILKAAYNATQRGDLTAAEACALRAERLLPDYFELWRIRAHIAETAGDNVGAREYFERAVEMADGSSEALLIHFATFLCRSKDFGDAISVMGPVIASPDCSAQALSCAAWACCQNAQLDQAVELYERAYQEVLSFTGVERNKILTQHAETLRRLAEHERRRERFNLAAKYALDGIQIIVTSASLGVPDQRCLAKGIDCLDEYWRVLEVVPDRLQFWKLGNSAVSDLADMTSLVASRLHTTNRNCPELRSDSSFQSLVERAIAEESSAPRKRGRYVGVVVYINSQGRYGFIKNDSLGDVYFNRDSLSHRSHWSIVASQKSVQVSFDSDWNAVPGKRPLAINVAVEGDHARWDA